MFGWLLVSYLTIMMVVGVAAARYLCAVLRLFRDSCWQKAKALPEAMRMEVQYRLVSVAAMIAGMLGGMLWPLLAFSYVLGRWRSRRAIREWENDCRA